MKQATRHGSSRGVRKERVERLSLGVPLVESWCSFPKRGSGP